MRIDKQLPPMDPPSIMRSPFSPYASHPATILIAENDILLRKTLCQMIMQEGYRVIEVDNGDDCIQSYLDHYPDLVLLNAQMTGNDGFSCCRTLTQFPGSRLTPVMVLTNLENNESIEQAFASGATDFVTKPIHWDLLRYRVRRLLQNKQSMLTLHSQVLHEQQNNALLEQQLLDQRIEFQKKLAFDASLKQITESLRNTLDESLIVETAIQELTSLLNVQRSYFSIAVQHQQEEGLACMLPLQLVPAALTHAAGGTAVDRLREGSSATRNGNHHSGSPANLFNSGEGAYASMAASIALANRAIANADWHPSLISPEVQVEVDEWLQQEKIAIFCPLVSAAQQNRVVVLACSVADQQETSGNLWLIKQADWVPDKLEVELVQEVTVQCAIAIHQARLHQKLQHQIAELEQLNQHKDHLLNLVSHELRSPLVNMRLAIQLLERSLLEATQQNSALQEVELAFPRLFRSQNYLNILRQECEREIRLVNNLLDLQRLEMQRDALPMMPIAPNAWLRQLVDRFEERISDRQLTLHLEIPDNLPHLISDPIALERVLCELLTNACKYTPPGEQIFVSATSTFPSKHLTIPPDLQPNNPKSGIHLPNRCCKSQLPASHNMSMIHLCVRNTGVVIPAQEHDRIFEKFYSIPGGDRRQQESTGLGLALVKELVEKLRGQVSVRTEANATCFIVSLPFGSPKCD